MDVLSLLAFGLLAFAQFTSKLYARTGGSTRGHQALQQDARLFLRVDFPQVRSSQARGDLGVLVQRLHYIDQGAKLAPARVWRRARPQQPRWRDSREKRPRFITHLGKVSQGVLIFTGDVRVRALQSAGRGQALGAAQLNQQVIIVGAHDRIPIPVQGSSPDRVDFR